MNSFKATVDFETRSACNLKACGAWKYSLDPTTEVMCLVFRLPYWPRGVTALWHPGYAALGIAESFPNVELLELCDWIGQGELIEAHSAFFERAIWTNILTPRYGFPLPAPHTWRCSAAKAAAHALPRKLEEAGAALHLDIQKDTEGHKLMMKLSKPRKARKKEREAWVASRKKLEDMPLLWWEDSTMFGTLWKYCASDVLSEECLSKALDDLSPRETPNYILDQTMNQRGFKVDMEAVQIALFLIGQEVTVLNAELETLTQGSVTRATQRDRMKAWLKTQDVHLFDTKGATIDEILNGEYPDFVGSLSPNAERALVILRTLGRSSTAKYETMLDWACPDGRVRGGLLYHGATTGRWSGAGVQPHNFPKGTIKGFDMEAAWELIKTGDKDAVAARWGHSVMEVLACALRGAIIATKGCDLFVADYAGIEVRVLWWVADDKVGLKLIHTGADPYCSLATAIYHREITKEDGERQLGKAGILGCGYGMGAAKFVGTAKDMFGLTVTDEESQTVVNTYRQKFHRTKSFWYETEDAACAAVLTPGKVVKQKWVSWQRVVDDARGTDFLFCTLPNGRRLAYPFPELRQKETPWGEMKWALTFKAVNAYTRKWTREHTYGGKLVENIVQAISRDIMAEALQRCEAGGVYIPVLSVHDEVVAEVKSGHGDVTKFEQLLTEVPTWAPGCPIGAKGWKGSRYRK
jgi:Mesyanzhinovviridae DNA polymerase I